MHKRYLTADAKPVLVDQVTGAIWSEDQECVGMLPVRYLHLAQEDIPAYDLADLGDLLMLWTLRECA